MLTTETPKLESIRAVAPVRHRPRPIRFGARHAFVLRLVDLFSLAFAAAIVLKSEGIWLRGYIENNATQEILAVLALGMLLWFERLGMYSRTFATSARDEVYATLAAVALTSFPVLIVVWLLPAFAPYREFTTGLVLVGAGTLSLGRFVSHAARTRWFPPRVRRIVVAGTPDRVAAIPGELALTATDTVQRYAIDSFDDELRASLRAGGVSALEWVQYAVDHQCTEIIVTEALPPEIMPSLLAITERHKIRLAFAPTRIRPHACEFEVRRDGGLALMYPSSLSICRPVMGAFKRTLDVGLAALALLLLALPLAIVAAAVYFDSGLPVFYRQVRVGRNGKTFEIIKFRTMRNDAEVESGPVWARSGEARTTRIGRFLRRTSLDELPQLFNVLQGHMSIVGPRPERPFYVEQFKAMFPRYDERHLVRPGITGWSHIHMRRNVDTSAIGERLAYDLFYLEHWSVFMDLLIICKTGAEFLFHSAA
jgi:exopolysaccharide biosynthesis polyprenyl glycosylphosphotransferase